jgi:hypothetical protein
MRLQFPAVRLGDEFAWWRCARQGDEGAALGLTQPRWASGTRLHAQPVEAARVEGVDALTHCLEVAGQFLSDGAGASPIPTGHNHPSMPHPIRGGMMTPRHPAHLTFFCCIQRWTSSE